MSKTFFLILSSGDYEIVTCEELTYVDRQRISRTTNVEVGLGVILGKHFLIVKCYNRYNILPLTVVTSLLSTLKALAEGYHYVF